METVKIWKLGFYQLNKNQNETLHSFVYGVSVCKPLDSDFSPIIWRIVSSYFGSKCRQTMAESDLMKMASLPPTGVKLQALKGQCPTCFPSNLLFQLVTGKTHLNLVIGSK